MKKKSYLKPESCCVGLRTEQGICYSSGQDTFIQTDTDEKEGIVVDPYKEIDNEITFD